MTLSSTETTKDLQDMAAGWARENVSVATIWEAEQVIVEVARKLAQSMMAAAVEKLDREATYEGTGIACDCGERARFVSYRSRWIRTLCGDIEAERAYYHCKECGRGYLPWDRGQGLDQRIWSPGVKALVAESCARLTYTEVSKLFERVLGFSVEESSQQDIVGDIGSRLRAQELDVIDGYFERDKAIETDARPSRLYVSMDAAKAHTGGGWHDIKTGVVFEGKRPPRDSERKTDEMQGARYVAIQETSEEFGRRLYARALASGAEHARQVVVIGDGAEWIWNEAAIHFHGSVEILDYYHACEHIWSLANTFYGEGSSNGKRWAETHCRKLKRAGPTSLLRALCRRKARTAEQKESLRRELAYIRTHRKRMQYPKYLARDMMIGSGPVESACKVVVGQRLKQAGMRWSEDGADAILALRTAVLNDESDRIEWAARAA